MTSSAGAIFRWVPYYGADVVVDGVCSTVCSIAMATLLDASKDKNGLPLLSYYSRRQLQKEYVAATPEGSTLLYISGPSPQHERA